MAGTNLSGPESPQVAHLFGTKELRSIPAGVGRITTEYEDLLDALRRYPPAERAQETLYYECEIPQDSGASYHRADALLPGERAFTLRQVYRGAIQREVCDVSDKN